jgi:lysozyme family protein
MMNTMTYEEAYDLYRKMWEKKLAKGNMPDPSAPSSSEPAIKAGSAA